MGMKKMILLSLFLSLSAILGIGCHSALSEEPEAQARLLLRQG